jgi:pimeloyl-ACP methyl ester carboxylesterase
VSVKTIRLPSSTANGTGPRGDLYEDATQVRAVLDSLRGPIMLCGHSYGGAVITEAAAGPHPAVRRLVYLTGAVPDVGESLASLVSAAEESNGAADAAREAVRLRPDGMVELDPDSARTSRPLHRRLGRPLTVEVQNRARHWGRAPPRLRAAACQSRGTLWRAATNSG